MAIPRLFIDAPFAPQARVPLNEAQGRYLVAVLRLPPGGGLTVFNGVDGEWAARVDNAGKRGVTLVLEGRVRPQASGPDLALCFSPVKRHGTDLIVEKATELGARRLRPVVMRRTTAETVRTDRLRAIAIEAAEQTGRCDVPAVDEALALARLLEGWDGRPLLFADEGGDAAPIATVLQTLATQAAAPAAGLAVLTGPEGGFDPEERRILRALPFVTPVSLGPRILRAETAVIAALALIQAHWGDWRLPSSPLGG
ncbi:MAG: 16S rRNA (uracil(1498)-N(3))-methyltransferase [Hyphomonadaceae bacterium]|nr:16S rRNA (uracil(1498)-N(3))-methyltransferase [Hyphomonadaceae bacterium]